MQEQIDCQYCGRQTQITEDCACKCGAELFLTQSLRQLIDTLEKEMIALRLRQGKAIEELCRRERARNMKRDGYHVSNRLFWQNVYGKPQWAGRPKTQQARRPVIDMAQFD
jgi:hypothetical protein